MKKCEHCGMPDTRPNSPFTGNVCTPCHNYSQREQVNYTERQAFLRNLCAERKLAKAQYDCLVPVSGGKDSTIIVATLVEEYGMRPLLVTILDEFTPTKAGIHNRNNISEYFDLDHICFRPAPRSAKEKMLQLFIEECDPIKEMENCIRNFPVQIAKKLSIPLVFIGEDSNYEYGGTKELATKSGLSIEGVEVYHLFGFYPYNEIEIMNKAKSYGYKDLDDTQEWFRQGNVENFTQIDSIGYLMGIWTKYPKFGFQRVSDIATRFFRRGEMSKKTALQLIHERDHICDPQAKLDFCKTVGITEDFFDGIVDKHANKELLQKDYCGVWRRKDLL